MHLTIICGFLAVDFFFFFLLQCHSYHLHNSLLWFFYTNFNCSAMVWEVMVCSYVVVSLQVRLCREKKSGDIFAMKKLKKSEMLSRGQVTPENISHLSSIYASVACLRNFTSIFLYTIFFSWCWKLSLMLLCYLFNLFTLTDFVHTT